MKQVRRQYKTVVCSGAEAAAADCLLPLSSGSSSGGEVSTCLSSLAVCLLFDGPHHRGFFSFIELLPLPLTTIIQMSV